MARPTNRQTKPTELPVSQPVGGRGCEVLRSARLFVCLFLCLSARISRNYESQFHQIFSTCYLWPWLVLPLTAVQCVIYFRFYWWRHVSHNGANGPESKTTHVSTSSSGGGTGGEVCRLWLHLVRSPVLRTRSYVLRVFFFICQLTFSDVRQPTFLKLFHITWLLIGSAAMQISWRCPVTKKRGKNPRISSNFSPNYNILSAITRDVKRK